jgi:hypothetical protein
MPDAWLVYHLCNAGTNILRDGVQIWEWLRNEFMAKEFNSSVRIFQMRLNLPEFTLSINYINKIITGF